MIWGEEDPVCVTAVAHHVYTNFLLTRSTPATYHLLPSANHYLITSHALDVSTLIKSTLQSPPLKTTPTWPAPKQDL